MELVTHLQVFPLPSGNTKRSKERKKKRGVRKRGTPLSQPPSCPGQALLPTTFTFSTPALAGASWPLTIKPSPLSLELGKPRQVLPLVIRLPDHDSPALLFCQIKHL